jgi:transcriptional regulator with XRE-family HTH domain
MPRKFRELIAKKPPEWHAMVAARKRELLAEMPLQELRRARQLSQEALAEALGASQPEVSKIEHRTDLYVSTLRRYVEAMGGELEITARFPEGTVRIIQFRDLEAAAASSR